jgi:hypothetical protein
VSEREFTGSATLVDGTRVTLSAEECEAMWNSAMKAKADRAASMPTERAALEAMHDAFTRLKELGWRDAIYCPKDGSMFDAISAGSTGIHDTHYEGKWPTGSWWAHEAGDLWPSHPILFKPKAPTP